MPSKLRLRTIFAPLVKLLARGFAVLHVTPNGATILMLCCALCSIVFLTVFRSLLAFGVMVFITGLMDGVDGAIARLTHQKSQFGGFFDSTMDRVSEAVLFLGLLINASWLLTDFGVLAPVIPLLLFLFSSMISYTRARFELALLGGDIKPDANVGLVGRSERLFYLFLLSLLSAWLGLHVFTGGILLFLGLIIGTFLFRCFDYRRVLMH